MTTVEFEANKAELARQILCTDSTELVEAIKKTYLRFNKRQIAKQIKAPACIEGVPCTLEEVKQEIAEFEAELDAGTLETIPHKQVMQNIRKLIANL